MADDESGTIDAVGHRRLVAHDGFRIVLGAKVRVVEVLGLLEHVLAEHAVVEARGGDRADVVEASGADRLRETDRVARAVDIGLLLRFGRRGEVVDRGEVEHVVDLALELAQVGRGDAQLVTREIAGDGDEVPRIGAATRAQFVELRLRTLAQQHEHGPAALDQVGDEEAADESGRAGDEVRHVESSRGTALKAAAATGRACAVDFRRRRRRAATIIRRASREHAARCAGLECGV